MEYRIRVIDRAHSADIRLKNEPFSLYGRLIPSCVDGKWDYTVRLFEEKEVSEMCFPDENYDYGAMAGDHTFIGAYDGDTCVGLAVMAEAWFRYMYLDDLKVNRAYRGQGVGRSLIRKAMEVALEKGYNGIYAIGQENNLAACKFYLRCGFEIGGFDNRVYHGTSLDGNADIYFYLDR